MYSKRIAVALTWAVLSLVTSSADARAAVSEPMRASIEAMLGERHPEDRAEPWLALGPGAVAALIELYQEPGRPTRHRARILGALSYFDDPEALAFLRAEAEQASRPALLKRGAVRSVGLSPQAGGAEEAWLAAKLGDAASTDPQDQIAAAESLRALKRRRTGRPDLGAELESKLSPVARERLRPLGERARVQPLTPVATNAGNARMTLLQSWAGRWRGWVVQSGRGGREPSAFALELELSPAELEPKLTVGAAKIDAASSKTRARGSWRVGAGVSTAPMSWRLERQDGEDVLRLERDDGLAVALLKRVRAVSPATSPPSPSAPVGTESPAN